jgi:integrase
MMKAMLERDERQHAAGKTPLKGVFVRVGTNLYRFTTSGSYFALVRRHGKQLRHNLRTKDRKVADRELRLFLSRLDATGFRPGRVTVDDLVRRYLELQKGRPRGTRATREGLARRFLAAFRGRRADDLKPSDLKKWHATATAGFSKATRNEYLRMIRAVFQIGVEDGMVYRHPCEGWKEERRGTPERLTPTWEQFNALVAAIRSNLRSDTRDEAADFVEFLGLSGVGNSEAADMMWSRVDWQRGKIQIKRNKTGQRYEIPIFPQVRPLLERLFRDSDGTGPVFGIRDAKKAIAAACKRLGYPAFSHRSFRRLFVTRCIEKGIDFKTIAAWQGHRDGGVLVAKTYSHLRTEHADAMAEKLS